MLDLSLSVLLSFLFMDKLYESVGRGGCFVQTPMNYRSFVLPRQKTTQHTAHVSIKITFYDASSLFFDDDSVILRINLRRGLLF